MLTRVPDFRSLLSLVREVAESFSRHNDALLGAAIAFYAMMSGAPLAVIAVGVAGLVLGPDAAHGELRQQLSGPLGPGTADLVSKLMVEAREPLSGGIATLLGGAVVLFAASRLFVHTHNALNHVMGVRAKTGASLRRAARQLAQERLMSFAMVFLCGGLLIALLVLRTGVTAVTAFLARILEVPVLWRAAELSVSVAILAFLFTVIFRLLPDIRMAWTDAWVGAWVTAILVGFGTVPIGWFLGRFGAGSVYGAAGTLVVLLLWVYYSAQIFFVGAEFTRAWAVRHGQGVRPSPYAVRVVEEDSEVPRRPA
jgi:membrane protein